MNYRTHKKSAPKALGGGGRATKAKDYQRCLIVAKQSKGKARPESIDDKRDGQTYSWFCNFSYPGSALIAAFFILICLQYHQMKAKSMRQTPQQATMVISAGIYLGASFGRKVCGPVVRLVSAFTKCTGTIGAGPPTDNVSHTITYQVYCCNRRLLGIASNVGGDQGQQSHEGAWGCLSEIVSCQTT